VEWSSRGTGRDSQDTRRRVLRAATRALAQSCGSLEQSLANTQHAYSNAPIMSHDLIFKLLLALAIREQATLLTITEILCEIAGGEGEDSLNPL